VIETLINRIVARRFSRKTMDASSLMEAKALRAMSPAPCGIDAPLDSPSVAKNVWAKASR
jgi:hypothetical protein